MEVRPTISKANLRKEASVKVIEERRYKFIIIGPKGRFAIARDGTIYGFKNNDVNRKEQYGNVETFEEFDWSRYYPIKRSLYDWKTETPPVATNKRKTRKRTMVDQVSKESWPFTEGISKVSKRTSEQCTKLGDQGTTQNRHLANDDRTKSTNSHERSNKK